MITFTHRSRTRSRRRGNSARRYRSRQPFVCGLERDHSAGLVAAGDGVPGVGVCR